MPCYSPLIGYRSARVNDSGKRSIVFNPKYAISPVVQQVPCGQCVGCRLKRSSEWATRCLHEASLYDYNTFLTLTYAPEHLPANGSLVKKDHQDFMKRLRERFQGVELVSHDSGLSFDLQTFYRPIRFYHCGEYGDKLGRPHYHTLLFNFDFTDKIYWKTVNGNPLYLSSDLQSLWTKGYSAIGNVTFKTAAYVARYVMKKINGDRSVDHYRRYGEYGEVIDLVPEYNTMSRRPGIASEWFRQFKDDVYPHDSVVIDGREIKPPRFYDKLYEIDDLYGYEFLKKQRRIESLKHVDNTTIKRLDDRVACANARLKMLIRPLE